MNDNFKDNGGLGETVDKLERENRLLNRKIKELNSDLEEKEADVRLLKKKMTNSGNVESNYNKMLNKFTKQTKDQYKRYEVYLKHSEELLEYCLFHFNKSAELSHKIIESITTREKVDFKALFSLEGNAGLKKSFTSAVDKFSRSQFLAKKKLFVNIKKRLKVDDVLKLEELQKKFDKTITEEQSEDSKKHKKLSIPSYDLHSLSITKEKSFNISLNEQKKKQDRRGTCKNVLEELAAAGHSMLSDQNWLSGEQFNDLTTEFSKFHINLKNHMMRFKERLKTDSKGKTEIETKDIDNDVEMFNEDIDVIKRNFAELEKLEYQRLIDLREKNSNLSIIQNHIKNISEDNDRLADEISDNEFHLTVNREIIAAYEKSMREKKERLKQCKEQLGKTKGEAEKFNEQVSDILGELIGFIIRNRRSIGNK